MRTARFRSLLPVLPSYSPSCLITMSSGPFPVLLHATALSVMTYGYMALPQVLAGNIPIHELKGGHFQFLTIQG